MKILLYIHQFYGIALETESIHLYIRQILITSFCCRDPPVLGDGGGHFHYRRGRADLREAPAGRTTSPLYRRQGTSYQSLIPAIAERS